MGYDRKSQPVPCASVFAAFGKQWDREREAARLKNSEDCDDNLKSEQRRTTGNTEETGHTGGKREESGK